MSLNKICNQQNTGSERWMHITCKDILADELKGDQVIANSVTAVVTTSDIINSDDVINANEIKCEDLSVENNITAGEVDTQSLKLDGLSVYPWKLQNGVAQNTQTLKIYQLVDLEGTTYIRLKGSDIGGESAGIGTPNFYVKIYLPTEYVDTWDFDTAKNFHLGGSGVWNNTVAYHFCIAWNLSTGQDPNGKYCTITYNTIQGIAPENPYTWKVSYEILYPLKPAVP